ncbi:MAG TPA: hypothetical protein VLB47_13105, partial [Solirubrobacteraceae bacterium]|nr:hypothetical protein [Solirubrobacteraceae bacterium]
SPTYTTLRDVTRATAHIDFKRSVVRTTDPVPIRTFALVCARHVVALGESEVAKLESSSTRGADHKADNGRCGGGPDVTKPSRPSRIKPGH